MSARHGVAAKEKFSQREGAAATKKIRKRERCFKPAYL